MKEKCDYVVLKLVIFNLKLFAGVSPKNAMGVNEHYL